MSKEFLSQDEVDALLKGVTGEADAVVESGVAQDGTVARPYNLASQERIVRGRMPTLESINDRFLRFLRIGLFNLIRRTPEITAGPVRVLKYGEFVRNLSMPSNLNMVQVKPLRGTALIIINPDLVFLFVDNLFGGDGRFHTRVEGREFTQTEQRIIQSVLSVIFEGYEKSWEPVYQVKFEYIRSELNTRFANIATPNEVVVATTFHVGIGNAGGEFHICMPYSMIQPIRDVLYSSLQGDHMEVDKRWVQMLSKQVQLAEVELVANLGQAPVTLRQILEMQVGDVVSLEIPEAIMAEVDGIPVLECKYGVFNGQYALKVDKILSTAKEDD